MSSFVDRIEVKRVRTLSSDEQLASRATVSVGGRLFYYQVLPPDDEEAKQELIRYVNSYLDTLGKKP